MRATIKTSAGETVQVAFHHSVVLGIAQTLAASIRRQKLRFAELGVWRGKLSQLIAQELPNSRLLCVDRWAPPPAAKAGQHKDAGDRMSLRPEDLVRGALDETKKRLAFAGDRVEIVQGETDEVGKTRGDSTLDFAFLDGGHYKEQCLADCRAWWSKVGPGGILAGHDFGGRYDGVTAAVKQFAKKVDEPLYRLDGHVWLIFRQPLREGLAFPQFNQTLVPT